MRLVLSLHNGILWAKLYARLYAGRFTEARATARKLAPRWRHVLGVSRDSARYCEALTLHLEGDFEGAIAALVGVTPRHRLLLEGASLVMLGRDAERACDLLREACNIHRMPEDLLFLALALQATEHADDARRVFDEAGTKRPNVGAMARINEPIFHYLRALYLLRLLRDERDALADLNVAANGAPPTIYVTRARALLPAPVDDGRSSLAAITIDE